MIVRADFSYGGRVINVGGAGCSARVGLSCHEAAAEAEAARDQQAKEIFREIAKQWRKLAEQAGKADGKAT